jgi:S-adenosylmethionine synthetase
MKRYAEAVLNGHPDKFCDLIADRLIRELYRIDSDAYAQIEVSVWSDVIVLTGGAVTRRPARLPVKEIIIDLGLEIGYRPDNHIDVRKYKILDQVCWIAGNPEKWTAFSNDQCIVIGYAGYDAETHYLPPEQFLVWHFREALVRELKSGCLQGHGPDGKLLVVMREQGREWELDSILVTLQQHPTARFLDMTAGVYAVLESTWNALKRKDKRWTGNLADVQVQINPNGPLLNGGSDGDNGQTGRKLVMDYYGPRIPIGGGAWYGKDMSHIDRLAGANARKLAVDLVKLGAKEAQVSICFGPGLEQPLSIDLQCSHRPLVSLNDYFSFSVMRSKIDLHAMDYGLETLGSYYWKEAWFNAVEEEIWVQ